MARTRPPKGTKAHKTNTVGSDTDVNNTNKTHKNGTELTNATGIQAPNSQKGQGNGKKRLPKANLDPSKPHNSVAGFQTTITTALLPAPTDRTLSVREAKFVMEFLKSLISGFDPYTAAVNSGYSERTARTQAYQILRRPHIVAEIKDQMQAMAIRHKTSIDKVFRHLSALVAVDPREMFNAEGGLKSPTEMTKEQALLLQSFHVEELYEREGRQNIQIGVVKKVRLINHLEPLKMLAQNIGMLEKTININQKIEEERTLNINVNIDYGRLTDTELKTLEHLTRKAMLRPGEKVVDTTYKEATE